VSDQAEPVKIPYRRCSSCNALIFWALTKNGKRIPIDAEPVSNGNLRVEWSPDFETATAFVVGPDRSLWPENRYVSHFSSCPNAAQHRRR
jgi:hypothetical protein